MIRTVEVFSSGLTIATTAYTSGDQVGSIFSFAPMTDLVGGRGVLRGVNITDEGDVLGACDLLLFSDFVTLPGDNNPYVITDAEARVTVAYIPFATADIVDFGNQKFGSFRQPVPFHTTRADNTLFGALITRSANAFFTAVSDVRIRLYYDTGSSNII